MSHNDDHPIRTLGEWRNLRYLTQKELAEALGVKLTTLRTWEQRVNHPHPAAWRKLAEYFGIAPWQITFDKTQTAHSVPPKAEAAA